MLVAGTMLASTIAGLAEDEARVKAGLTAWKTSGCPACHGAFADGDKEQDEAPTGANLRTTRLDNAALTEVIRCGRPDTGMPRFDEGAYTQRGCNGQGPGPVPSGLYPTPRMMSARMRSTRSSSTCGRVSSDGAGSRRRSAPTTTKSWRARGATRTRRNECVGAPHG